MSHTVYVCTIGILVIWGDILFSVVVINDISYSALFSCCLFSYQIDIKHNALPIRQYILDIIWYNNELALLHSSKDGVGVSNRRKCQLILTNLQSILTLSKPMRLGLLRLKLCREIYKTRFPLGLYSNRYIFKSIGT